MKFIRKISLAKWTNSLESDIDGFSADAITGCLRTTENTLSVWKCETEEEIEQSTLALLASQTRIDKLDIVKIDRGDVEERKLSVVESPGHTAAEVYANNHADIAGLNIDSLRLFAELVKEEVANGRSIRIGKADFIKRLQSGIAKGVIVESALTKEILAELEKAAAKS
ncbi:hypothetical protein L0Y47_13200 [Ectopseudomonas composti]